MSVTIRISLANTLWRCTDRADPRCNASANFSGIFAGELARSRTSCQYVLASKNIKMTLMKRKRKYLRRWKVWDLLAADPMVKSTHFFKSEYSIQLRAR